MAAYNWSGFYVGLHAGYASSDPRFDFTAGHYNNVPGDSFALASGFMAAVRPVTLADSDIVFGLEGSISIPT